jgi:hypothetical protein
VPRAEHNTPSPASENGALVFPCAVRFKPLPGPFEVGRQYRNPHPVPHEVPPVPAAFQASKQLAIVRYSRSPFSLSVHRIVVLARCLQQHHCVRPRIATDRVAPPPPELARLHHRRRPSSGLCRPVCRLAHVGWLRRPSAATGERSSAASLLSPCKVRRVRQALPPVAARS